MFDNDTDIRQDMIDNFLRNSQNKKNLNEYLSKKKKSTCIRELSIWLQHTKIQCFVLHQYKCSIHMISQSHTVSQKKLTSD